MRRIVPLLALAAVLAVGAAGVVSAQEAGSGLIAVGETAPDFALPGATRYGLIEQPVRLSDYRGETVVLAFFFRVRTGG
jgi:peroxiredoxin Q/BCP